MPAEDLSKLKIDKSAKTHGSPRNKRLLYIILFAFAAAILLVLYIKGYMTPAVTIDVVTVTEMHPSQTFTILNSSGYVVAQRKAALAAKITGRLVSLTVGEGNIVRKGQIVARLENEDTQANVNQARANLNMARANSEQAKSELDLAVLNYDRHKSLYDKGSVSKAEFDNAESRYKRAQFVVNSFAAAVNAAAAVVEAAGVAHENSFIKVPFDGVVLTKNADIGDIITPLGAAANSKAAVITIADMSSLEVETDVSEANLSAVKVKQPCEIQIDAIPDKRFRGVVQTIVPTADRSKAAVMVKVRFLEKDDRILPEMSAKVAFLSRPVTPDDQKSFIAINKTAVINRDKQKTAFLVKDKHVRETVIKTGREWGEMIELLDGLKPGDKVAVNPLHKLKDGSPVEIGER
ncbi:MAG: efflux RND transporter periplasmic adaptor subunit [Deltaproteobacteria bacterium HGW-Deltaproteobacteria-10]|nr:MAG: efflux RND transporter periplasmic adaptor subunit [Deltaproteobacteria bacterium HGW-Deltaproteobacteria-10]